MSNSGGLERADSQRHAITLRDGSTITHRELQDLYSKFAGESNEEAEELSAVFAINIDTIGQLHDQLLQHFDSLRAIVRTTTISVYFTNGRRAKFTSFSAFEHIFASSTPDCIETITIDCKFGVSTDGPEDLRNYSVSINLTSTVALKSKKGSISDLTDFLTFLERKSIRYKIKYVDYSIMRSVAGVVNDWASAHSTKRSMGWLLFFQRNSFHLRTSLPLLLSGGFLIFIGLTAPFGAWVISFENSIMSLATLLCGFLALAFLLMRELGRSLERSVDSVHLASMFEITAGDKNLNAEYKRRQSRNVYKLLISALSIIVTTAFLDVASHALLSYAADALK